MALTYLHTKEALQESSTVYTPEPPLIGHPFISHQMASYILFCPLSVIEAWSFD